MGPPDYDTVALTTSPPPLPKVVPDVAAVISDADSLEQTRLH